jgi:hypothetical protein
MLEDFCFFARVCLGSSGCYGVLSSSFDVVRLRVFLHCMMRAGGQHLEKRAGTAVPCKSGVYLFCTAYSHFKSCIS